MCCKSKIMKEIYEISCKNYLNIKLLHEVLSEETTCHVYQRNDYVNLLKLRKTRGPRCHLWRPQKKVTFPQRLRISRVTLSSHVRIFAHKPVLASSCSLSVLSLLFSPHKFLRGTRRNVLLREDKKGGLVRRPVFRLRIRSGKGIPQLWT